MSKILSIIVPLYNCEEYIAACLDSILEQDLSPEDYEVIVVNDGSTDSGADIVQSYVATHANFNIYHQPNQGVGSARNVGMHKTIGKYICFLDADDRIAPKGLNHLIDMVKENNPDIIFFGMQHVGDYASEPMPCETAEINFEGALKDYVMKYGFRPTVTNTLFNHILLKDLTFNSCPVGEDLNFMMEVFDKNSSCYVISINTPIYSYYMRQNSAMHTTDKKFIGVVINDYISYYRALTNKFYLANYPKSCILSFAMTHIQGVILTKMFAAGFTPKEIKLITNKCLEAGVFPLPYIPNRVVALLCWLTKHPVAGWMFSVLYRHIYIRYIKE